MARKGKEFELAYKWLYELNEQKYHVTSPAYLYDKVAEIKREVDVLIEYNDSNNLPRKIGIECRDRKGVEDVMWIEQLIQKKEDLCLDYLIATTTSNFSKSAIKKAKYHGVIIETAELLNTQTIEKNIMDFYFDAFFVKMSILKLNFLSQKYEIISFKELYMSLNVIDRQKLMNFINTDIYYSFNPDQFLEQHSLKDTFYSSENSNMIITKEVDIKESVLLPFLRSFKKLYIEIEVLPFKITMPLNTSLSVFEGDTHSNKNYRAIFGDENNFYSVGYLEGKMYHEIHINNSRKFRFTGANLSINTIAPNEDMWIDNSLIEQIAKDLLGEFNFKKIM